jgi:hypothetical protein
VSSYRGFDTCSCLAAWLPLFDQVATAKEFIDGPNAKILQLTGSNPASAGTHAEGGAFDLGYYSGTQARNLVWLARQMGADATWYRAWDNNHHVHGVLRGCAHNDPAQYQIDAVDDGYNGLGYMGQDGPDDGPKPLTYRTYTQGMDWAEGQLGDDDMPLTDDDLNKIASKVWNFQLADRFDDAGDGKASAATMMVRCNPGPSAINEAIRAAVWDSTTHTVFNEDPVSMKNMVRYAQGEAANAHKFAKAGSEYASGAATYSKSAADDLNALQAKPPPEGPSRESMVGFAALVGVLGVVLGAALTLALVALL